MYKADNVSNTDWINATFPVLFSGSKYLCWWAVTILYFFLILSVPQDEKLLRWKYVMIFLLGNTLACVVCAVFLNINDKRKVGSTLLQVELQLASLICWFIIVMFVVCCCLYTKYRRLTVQSRDHWMKSSLYKALVLIHNKSCILEIFFINFS